jgi:hypothetical protein
MSRSLLLRWQLPWQLLQVVFFLCDLLLLLRCFPCCCASAVQECTDVAEPAPEVLLPLLPFQKQFLAWGLKQVGCGCCCWLLHMQL